MIGDVVAGTYEIIAPIAEGGMGAVYEGRHVQTGQVVAVKVLRAQDLEKKITHVKRFQREVRAAGSIDTDHIAKVLDSGEDDDGRPFVVLERLHGRDLSQWLEVVSPVVPRTAIVIAAQACRGLQKAHDAGVVHRDIKPSNLFLSEAEDGALTVKLLDFGIAKLSESQLDVLGHQTALTKAGALLGSPVYMSPEQARGRTVVDERADMWSLGIVLYRMLCGRVPFPDLPLGELLMQLCSAPIPHIQDAAPWIAPEVAVVVHRALRRDPKDRYARIADFERALAQLVPRTVISVGDLRPPDDKTRHSEAHRAEITLDAVAPPVRSARRDPPSGPPPDDEAKASPLPPSGGEVVPRRAPPVAAAAGGVRQTLLLVAAGAALAVFALGLYHALRSPPPSPSPPPATSAP
ncbi:MAG: serine/threonine-protein kinase [Myxococcota bacterium]